MSVLSVALSPTNTSSEVSCARPVRGGGSILSRSLKSSFATGMAPLSAIIYELESLRCNGCGRVFAARPPPGVVYQKYDESVPAMIGLLKYGVGLPFNRLEQLQHNLGIPLPAGTQWELVEESTDCCTPVYEALLVQAACADVLYNDDTTMRVLNLPPLPPPEGDESGQGDERTGVFTTGIVSTKDDRKIALFFTGHKHAGENLSEVLAKRSKTLAPPIQMCDALPYNRKGSEDVEPVQTLLAHCLAHGRRQFVDVAKNVPEECHHVLSVLGKVYHHGAQAKELSLSPEERLAYHQTCPLGNHA